MKYLKITSMGLLAMALAACSSDDEALTSEELTRGVVKTEFNISVPPQTGTRMSEAVTQAQATPVFRGMQGIVMIPFGKNGAIAKTDVRLGDNLVLATQNAIPSIQAPNTIDALNANGTTSQLYKDVEVPIGTRSFLFYGEAKRTEATNQAQVLGQLNRTPETLNSNTPEGIKFDLETIYKEDTPDQMGTDLAAYLTFIANAKGEGTADWALADNMYNPLRKQFLNITGDDTTGKLMAGSSADVQALVQDLYTKLKDANNATATAIKTAILNATYAADSNNDGTLEFVVAKVGDLTDATKCYPSNIYLPDGAAVVQWTGSAFEVMTTNKDLGVNVAQLDRYAYPASLFYRANTVINTDNESKQALYTDGSRTWPELLEQYTNKPGTVAVNTKSIALVDQIQYAVGRFDVKVKATSNTLQDNEDKNITVGTDKFPVTGVVIGGQKQVDFEFKPVDEANEMTIYDNQVEANKYLTYTTDAPLVNRTLVLQTNNVTVRKVKFAIEFQNNSGEAFLGKDGLVPNGCKFYLLGEMDMDEEGLDKKVDHVFVQDYVTTVTATVGSLKKAYNIIPDLRAPKLELGLSVNLEWQAGNVFTADM